MRSIRGRLLLILLSGAGVLLLAAGAAVYLIARAGLMRQFDAGLGARAHTIAALIKLEPCRRRVGGPIEGCEVLELGDAPAETMRETFFMIWHEGGQIAKVSDNLGEMRLSAREPAEGEMVYDDVDLPDARPGRAVWYAFLPRVDLDDWEAVGLELADPRLLRVGAAVDRTPVDEALNHLLGALIAAGGGIGLSLALLLVAGIHWGLRPLEWLRAQLEGVEGVTLSRRLDAARTPRELVPVYRELNAMLDRVGQTLQRERSFADAAAHELRTPLAELRSAAEVALRWPEARSPETALREALEIGREMERLVESLLHISRGQAAAADEESAPAPIATIVRGCLDHDAEQISAKGIEVAVELNGSDTLAAPVEAVEIIVRNLIQNAVRYTVPAGRIQIHDGHGDNGLSELVVENGPVELTAEDVPHLFEPFWRREGSRSDRRRAGLGLAVVESVARAVGLRIQADLVGDRLSLRVASAD